MIDVMSRSRSAGLLPIVLVLASCLSRHDVEGTIRLERKIHDDLGINASVKIRATTGTTTLTILFRPRSPADAPAMKARIEALAKAEFRPQTCTSCPSFRSGLQARAIEDHHYLAVVSRDAQVVLGAV
jgi:hypothetical protein